MARPLALSDPRVPIKRRRIRERGQVLVLVALGAVALFGAVGLAIDGGRLYAERRDSQAASDIAATSAAYAFCRGQTEGQAITAGQAAAARNGFDDASPVINVAITRVGTSNGYQAAITSQVPATFGRILGFSEFPVSTEATGDCAIGPGGSGAAVHAGGDNCTEAVGKKQLDISGSTSVAFGGVHSNGNAYVTGSSHDFTNGTAPPDQFTYVTNPMVPGFGNEYEPGYPQQVASKAWPAGLAPGDAAGRVSSYRALTQASPSDNLYYVDGDMGGQYIADRGDGLYFAEGKINANVGGLDLDVTLVSADDEISISGSEFTLRAFQDNLIMFSGLVYGGLDKCDKFTVKIDGSGNNDWSGIIWAPHGLLQVSGSNSDFTGALLGWSVALNGSNLELAFDPTLFPGDPQILLLE